jgi:PTS system nitrogen regulatory IIA component
MNFTECLENSSVKLEIEGETKNDIITELVDLLYSEGKIKDRAEVLKVVFDRERQMSTGLQYGVAMPHGKTDTVDRMVVAIGLKKEGVDFDSLDGKPTRIFTMTISSSLHANEHIEFLAAVSSVFTHSSKRKDVLKVKNKKELIKLMDDGR